MYNVVVTQLCTEGRRRGEMLLRRAASVTFLTRFCASVHNQSKFIVRVTFGHIYQSYPRYLARAKKRWSQQVNNMWYKAGIPRIFSNQFNRTTYRGLPSQLIKTGELHFCRYQAGVPEKETMERTGHSLVEIGLVVLEKTIFKFRLSFRFCVIISPGKGHGPSL